MHDWARSVLAGDRPWEKEVIQPPSHFADSIAWVEIKWLESMHGISDGPQILVLGFGEKAQA